VPTRSLPPGWKRTTPLDGPEDYAKGEYLVEQLSVTHEGPEWYWSTRKGFYARPYPDPVTCAVACELFNGGCDAQEHKL
jgi:hypothetical protein